MPFHLRPELFGAQPGLILACSPDAARFDFHTRRRVSHGTSLLASTRGVACRFPPVRRMLPVLPCRKCGSFVAFFESIMPENEPAKFW